MQQEFGRKAQRRFMEHQGEDYKRDGESSWAFGKLEQGVRTADGSPAWPALVDQETAVGLRLFDTWEEAALAHLDGVRRLLALSLADKMSYLRQHHGLTNECLLIWAAQGTSGELAAERVLCLEGMRMWPDASCLTREQR